MGVASVLVFCECEIRDEFQLVTLMHSHYVRLIFIFVSKIKLIKGV